jgi:hypothetical protein
MSRQQFYSSNSVETVVFQKSGATSSPVASIASGGRNGLWKVFNGSETKLIRQTLNAYTGFTSDTNIRNIEFKANALKKITTNIVLNNIFYGNMDLTKFKKLGFLQIANNNELTGITLPYSDEVTTIILISPNPKLKTLDLSSLSNLAGVVDISNNATLSAVTNPTSNQYVNEYKIQNNNITGTLNMSTFTNLGASSSGVLYSIFSCSNNPNLTNVIFPISTNFFKNSGDNPFSCCFSMFGCNLDYVDFTKLSGATLVSGFSTPRIELYNNNMSADDVNHILVDFSGNATYNPTGWSDVRLNIGGTNANPDPSSGGYDGLAAISFLTGSPYNWTITY